MRVLVFSAYTLMCVNWYKLAQVSDSKGGQGHHQHPRSHAP